MSTNASASRIALTTDLSSRGRHFGDALLRWSDNDIPLGFYPIPVISLKGGDGPVLLVLGGTHGDEFEGPAAIMRLIHQLDPAHLNGQIIAIPALNAPALGASSRVSPLDGENLNRAFPGIPDGGPTAMLAYFLQTNILPRCDAAIDLHSGGKASFFQPCSLPALSNSDSLAAANMELARAFGLPLIWRLGVNNDNRSVNAAAERANVPMIATELGGGGGVDPALSDLAEAGVMNVLRFLGILDGEMKQAPPQRVVETTSPHDSLYAPGTGIFDRKLCAGQDIKTGSFAGWFHHVTEPERPPTRLISPSDGMVLAHTNRGFVNRGDMLVLIVRDVADGDS